MFCFGFSLRVLSNYNFYFARISNIFNIFILGFEVRFILVFPFKNHCAQPHPVRNIILFGFRILISSIKISLQIPNCNSHSLSKGFPFSTFEILYRFVYDNVLRLSSSSSSKFLAILFEILQNADLLIL